MTLFIQNLSLACSGDSILVQKQGEDQGHWFEGRVHVLRKEEVGLRFHHSFGWSAAQRYNVRFKLNRIPMRRQHQAMDSAFDQARVLFPSVEHVPRTPYARPPLQLFNPLLATNPLQLQAVNSIVQQKPGSIPFVIFGP
jgi:helicase MOV-10